MTRLLTGSAVCAGVYLLLLGVAPGLDAQVEFTNNFRYNSGQSIQPIFEGWSWAPDGSINMHFGYLNRNYVEEPSIPIGPDNNIEPGGPDRGQPTFFYTRTRRNLFTVNVPKDWGRTREMVWTVTWNGRSERAVGWLQPEWEIDPSGGAQLGGRTDPDLAGNQAPQVTVEAVAPVVLPAQATLRASLVDDGIPKIRPRGKPPVGQETPPTLRGGAEAPVNVPQVAGQGRGEGPTPPRALHVAWMVWRGPANVSFDPEFAEPKEGTAVVTARFAKAGEYVLRARATDTVLTHSADVRVIVR